LLRAPDHVSPFPISQNGEESWTDHGQDYSASPRPQRWCRARLERRHRRGEANPHASNPLPKAATSDFQQVTLAKGPDAMGEPIALAVLPDGSALHDSRDGTVYYTKDGVTTLAAKLNVYTHDEDGLQGLAVDPNFARNHWSTSTTPRAEHPVDQCAGERYRRRLRAVLRSQPAVPVPVQQRQARPVQ